LLERSSAFAQEDFEPGRETVQRLGQLKILIIGAGGLGCELLKDLAYMHIEIRCDMKSLIIYLK
jgi:NEDD8-activating enzyme E1